MTHDQAFGSQTPATFADPEPGCRGDLELIASDRPVLAGGGWASSLQEVYRCRQCGARLGLLDGRLAWVERRQPGRAPAPKALAAALPAHDRPRAVRGTGDAPSVRRVLDAIRRLADADGTCTAENAEINREAGISSRRTGQYALAHLARSGAIKIEGGLRAADGRRIIVLLDPQAPRPDPPDEDDRAGTPSKLSDPGRSAIERHAPAR